MRLAPMLLMLAVHATLAVESESPTPTPTKPVPKPWHDFDNPKPCTDFSFNSEYPTEFRKSGIPNGGLGWWAKKFIPAGVVLRLVEKHGAGGRAFVTLPGFATAESVDLVERPAALAGFEWDAGARVATVPLRPFGIVSLRLRAEAGS